MLAKFSDLTIKVSDATISATDRVGQHISRTALEAVRHLEKGIDKSKNRKRDVERAHRMWEETKGLEAALLAAADELEDGRVAESLRTTDMLVEMLRQLEPETDFTELNDTKQRVDDTVAALREAASVCAKRHADLDACCKRITTIAVAKAEDPLPFLQKYELVDEIEIGDGPSASDIADQHKLALNEIRSMLAGGAGKVIGEVAEEKNVTVEYATALANQQIDRMITQIAVEQPTEIANLAKTRAWDAFAEEAKSLCLEWYNDRLAAKSKNKAYKRQKQEEQTRKELAKIWGDDK